MINQHGAAMAMTVSDKAGHGKIKRNVFPFSTGNGFTSLRSTPGCDAWGPELTGLWPHSVLTNKSLIYKNFITHLKHSVGGVLFPKANQMQPS